MPHISHWFHRLQLLRNFPELSAIRYDTRLICLSDGLLSQCVKRCPANRDLVETLLAGIKRFFGPLKQIWENVEVELQITSFLTCAANRHRILENLLVAQLRAFILLFGDKFFFVLAPYLLPPPRANLAVILIWQYLRIRNGFLRGLKQATTLASAHKQNRNSWLNTLKRPHFNAT